MIATARLAELWSITGRANRFRYLCWSLFSFVAAIGCAVAPAAFYLGFEWGWALGAIALALLWPAIAAHVRRLHDLNLSGWWILVGFIPYIGALGLFVVCGFLPGSPENNRYGKPPLQRGASLALIFAAPACMILIIGGIAIRWRLPILQATGRQIDSAAHASNPLNQPGGEITKTSPISVNHSPQANSPVTVLTSQQAPLPSVVNERATKIQVDDTQLYLAANEINSRLPELVNNETRFDSVQAAHSSLRYNYTLVNRTALHLPADGKLDNRSLINYYCNQQKEFVESGVLMSWAYHTQNGKLIKVLSASPSQCK